MSHSTVLIIVVASVAWALFWAWVWWMAFWVLRWTYLDKKRARDAAEKAQLAERRDTIAALARPNGGWEHPYPGEMGPPVR